jgi:hypothetical protein
MAKRRRKRGAWSPGESGNPNGRPRNALTLQELATAIRAVEKRKDPTSKKKRSSLIEHFIERAYINDTLLLGLFKKFIPDLSSFDAFIGVCEDRLNEDTAKSIRKKLKERFKK